MKIITAGLDKHNYEENEVLYYWVVPVFQNYTFFMLRTACSKCTFQAFFKQLRKTFYWDHIHLSICDLESPKTYVAFSRHSFILSVGNVHHSQ
jgi:hypothetical protein